MCETAAGESRRRDGVASVGDLAPSGRRVVEAHCFGLPLRTGYAVVIRCGRRRRDTRTGWDRGPHRCLCAQPGPTRRGTSAGTPRLRFDPRTQEYCERRTREGKTRREIIRCLKRYAAPEVFNLAGP